MIDRKRLAVSGLILAVVAFAAQALLGWTLYQRDLASQSPSFDWTPSYWDTLRNITSFSLTLLIAMGIGMVVVAIAIRPPEIPNDAPLRSEPPSDGPFRPEA